MRLATLRTPSGSIAVRIDGETAVTVPGFADVGALLHAADWRTLAAAADGPEVDLAELGPEAWEAVVPAPSKIVCVGLNYRNHILEMGRDLPEYPTLFAKYPEALIGPNDPIVVPAYAAGALDWEGELAVVIGATVRRSDPEEASDAIAGYSVINDVTMRDFQYRTPEWFQGKTFERSSPFGPVLVTSDEWRPSSTATLSTVVDGETVQSTPTDDLVFGPAALVSYISHIVTLQPGDVIATGTPGGVGHARKPPRYLTDGSVLDTAIDGIGGLTNRVVVE